MAAFTRTFMVCANNICLSWLPLILLCGCLVGCGKGNVETDPKALADEAAKIDKQVAEGEKGL